VIKDLIDSMLGKILMGAAIAWAVVAAVSNSAQKASFPDEAKVTNAEKVQVALDLKSLATASPEFHFPVKDAAFYSGSGRYVFVKPVRKKEFVPVELDIPVPNLTRPPQLLPNPGPSLEGAGKLPRWGDELPALLLERKKKGVKP